MDSIPIDIPIKAKLKRGMARMLERLENNDRRTAGRVLLYHSVTSCEIRDTAQMATSVDLLEEQMRFLRSEQYVMQPSPEYVCRLRSGAGSSEKTVAVTFDDGLVDNYHLAYPVLRRNGIPATFFIITSVVDAASNGSGDGRYMTWKMLREMNKSEIVTIGCHTATHCLLSGMRERDLRTEISGAKSRLEQMLDQRVDLFAYPFGSYDSWDDTVRSVVKSAGFVAAFTNVFGPNPAGADMLTLRRCRVSWSEDLGEFDRLLRGYYDWYAIVQRSQAGVSRARRWVKRTMSR